MAPSLRTYLVGSTQNGSHPYPDLALAVFVFAAVFSAYALGIFAVSGGVIFIAGEAAAVGVLAAVIVAYRGSGLAFAWLIVYASLLGQRADHYILGLSYRSLAARASAFAQSEGMVVVAIQALALGVLAWVVGAAARRGFVAVRKRQTPPDAG